MELLLDISSNTYINDGFSLTHPSIPPAFASLNLTILRADFLRYLILLVDGGVYTDIDTRPLKPISEWIPPSFRHLEQAGKINLLIGIEVDDVENGTMFPDVEADFQFCQWTIMSRPSHPILSNMVERILSFIAASASTSTTTSLATTTTTTTSKTEEEFSLNDVERVMDVTGPRIWTEVVLQTLGEMNGRRYSKEDFGFWRGARIRLYWLGMCWF